MREKEKLIKERRLSEATNKGFFGLDGKIGQIVKYLGSPIEITGSYSDGISMYESNPMPNVWDIEDQSNTIPIIDVDEFGDIPVEHIGYHFDGLNRGIHMEIKYDPTHTKLSLHYKGYLVYEEVAGELICYVPHEEWEKIINKLYKQTKPKRKERIKEMQELEIEEGKAAKSSFLDKMKRIWGV